MNKREVVFSSFSLSFYFFFFFFFFFLHSACFLLLQFFQFCMYVDAFTIYVIIPTNYESARCGLYSMAYRNNNKKDKFLYDNLYFLLKVIEEYVK